jgi:hypothetical protein
MPQLTDTHVTQPDTPDPNIVQGKRKCCLTERLHENSDPFSSKRATKKAASSAILTVSNPPIASTSLSRQGLDTAASSNDRLDRQLIDIDDSDLEDSRKDDDDKGEATEADESDGAELGRSPIATISDLNIYQTFSTTEKGVGCTNLYLLQTSPNSQIC